MSRNAPRHLRPTPPADRPAWGRTLLESRRVLVLLVALSLVVALVALARGVATAAAPATYGALAPRFGVGVPYDR